MDSKSASSAGLRAAVAQQMIRLGMRDLVQGIATLDHSHLSSLAEVLNLDDKPAQVREVVEAMFPTLTRETLQPQEAQSMLSQTVALTGTSNLNVDEQSEVCEHDDGSAEGYDSETDDNADDDKEEDDNDELQQQELKMSMPGGTTHADKRLQSSLPTAEELAAIRDPRARIDKPAVAMRTSAGGRRYMPKISQSTIIRVTGLSQTEWKQVRQLVRSLFTAHKLDALKDGQVQTWDKKNWRNKEAAYIGLENQFPVLKRCVAHWAAEALFEGHYEYHRDKVRSKKSNATQDDSTVNTRSVPAAPKLKSTSSVQTLQSTPSPAPQPVQSPAAMAKKRGRPKGKSLAAKTSKTPKTANKKASSGKTLAASVSDKSMDVLTSSQFAAQHGLASDNYSVPADGSQLPIDPRLLQSQPLPSSTAAATHSINPLQYASSGPSISDMLRPPMSHTSSTVTLQLQEPSPYQSPESSTASKSASQQLPTPYPTPVSMRTADLTPSGDRPPLTEVTDSQPPNIPVTLIGLTSSQKPRFKIPTSKVVANQEQKAENCLKQKTAGIRKKAALACAEIKEQLDAAANSQQQ